jgi:hypothetical protein
MEFAVDDVLFTAFRNAQTFSSGIADTISF